MTLLKLRRRVDRDVESSVDAWHRSIHELGRASGFDVADAIAADAADRHRPVTVRHRRAA